MAGTDAAALVHRFTCDVWNARRLDALDELVIEDYELRNLSDSSVALAGRRQLRAHIEEWLAAFPDLAMRETELLAEGDRAATVVQAVGTHTGAPFLRVPAGGAPIDVTIVAFFRSDGTRLTGHGALVDVRRLAQQLARTERISRGTRSSGG